MKRRLTIVATCAARFAGVSVANATPPEGHENNGHGNHGSSAAAKLCAAEKKADHAAFKAVWGKHAMRDCIRAGPVRAGHDGRRGDLEFVNAAQECREARDADPAVFAPAWGTNHNHRNAFGKCVSQYGAGAAPSTIRTPELCVACDAGAGAGVAPRRDAHPAAPADRRVGRCRARRLPQTIRSDFGSELRLR